MNEEQGSCVIGDEVKREEERTHFAIPSLSQVQDLPFKETNSFTQRHEEATKIMKKYPERIPVICERAKGNRNVPELDKKKYLIPLELTVGQLMSVVRRRIKLDAKQTLYLLITSTNSIPTAQSTVSDLYHRHKDADNFLYFTYCGEDSFGSSD